MTDVLNDHEGTVSIGGRSITNLRFAGLAGREEELADLVERLDRTSTAFGQCREDQTDDQQHQWLQH